MKTHSLLRSTDVNEVGFYTGASQHAKRWMADCWIALGEKILDNTRNHIVIYDGKSDIEDQLAQEVYTQLHSYAPRRVSLVISMDLLHLCFHFTGLQVLITNDTFAVHAASALGLPCLGLFFSTNGIIWGSDRDTFTPVQSHFALVCPFAKLHAGNCEYYYGGCPAPCQGEVTPGRVFEVFSEKFSHT